MITKRYKNQVKMKLIMSLRGILVRTRCAVPEVLVIRAVSVHFVHYCLLLARGGTSVQPHCKCRFAHA
jgi:hypothetical protein